MIIDVVHTTRFSYDAEVVEAAMEARLEPRDDQDQRRISFSLDVAPATRARAATDGFGNTVHYFTVPQTHDAMVLTARSRVETLLANPFSQPRGVAVDPDPVDVWSYLRFGGPVLDVPEVQQLAARFRPGAAEQVLAALQGLMGAIYADFDYQPEVTDVTSTVVDLLDLKRGVCQDFTHLFIAVSRAMDIPARYVSGYICSASAHASRGDGASHAWSEAWVPGYGWRGFDATNNVLSADMHVKVGIGRNYHDVPPTRGVYRGTSGQQVDVRVKTLQIDRHLPSY